MTSLRIGHQPLVASGYRSLSEERPMGHPSPPPPFRGRNNSSSAAGNGNNFRSFNTRPLTRSSRAEEIPDIYWEQAARELDFCTCRKCQVSTKIVVTFFLRLRNEFQPFPAKNQVFDWLTQQVNQSEAWFLAENGWNSFLNLR